MAEVYFEFLTIPYLYDTKQYNLFQMNHNKLIEIDDQKIKKNVRFNAVEISQERAFF
jgi:hypothetical protein